MPRFFVCCSEWSHYGCSMDFVLIISQLSDGGFISMSALLYFIGCMLDGFVLDNVVVTIRVIVLWALSG